MHAPRAKAGAKLEELVASERRVLRHEQPPKLPARIDRPVVSREPGAWMTAPLEALFRGLGDVVDVRKEAPGEGVHIFPAPEDRAVHQEPRIEAQRFSENARRGVLDACDEQQPRRRELAHEIWPGKL